MKKLFLSSVACNTLDKVTELLPDKPNKLKLAFIPTAANMYTQKEWLYKDRDKLVEMGFLITDLDIANKDKEQIKNELGDADVVFVSGGNSYYLMDQVNKTGFREIINELINKGVVYIGSSAGSVITCPTIGMVEGLDDKNEAPLLESLDGLNLVDFLIFVHYGEEDCKLEYETIKNNWINKGYDIKYLTNYQAVVVNGDNIRVVEV